jgi:hypothetical protein
MSLEHVKQLLYTSESYLRFFTAAGEATGENPSALETYLREEAGRVLKIAVPSTDDLLRLQRTAAAMGILAAHQPESASQKDRLTTLLSWVRGTEGPLPRHVVASELTYIDQYLRGDVRQWLYKQITALKVEGLTPSIADYLKASQQTSRLQQLLEVVQPQPSADGINVYFICSAKGGVGKSLTALALLHFLCEKQDGCNQVAIMDLDTSGPTLQFTLDVPEVSRWHSMPPLNQEIEGRPSWWYWSLLDVLGSVEKGIPHVKEKAARNSILQTSDGVQASVVLLPDSPTYAAIVSEYWERELGREHVLDAIANVLGRLVVSGHKHVIFDCRPGLFGANGFLLRWVSQNFPTYLLVMSSPNAADIGTTLYEALWIAAAGVFRWNCKPYFLVNMWPDKELFATMDKWADKYAQMAVDASKSRDFTQTTSASQIYASRMWSYLYWRALMSTAPLRVASLREEVSLRHVLDPPDDGRFAFRWEKLVKSSWYDEDLRSIFSTVLGK